MPLSILVPSEDVMHIIEEFWGPYAPRALPLKLESLLAVHLGWFGYMGHCEWTNRWSPPKKIRNA